MQMFKKVLALHAILLLAIVLGSNSLIEAKEAKVNKESQFVLDVFAFQGKEFTDVYVKLSDPNSNNDFPSKLDKVQLKYFVNGEDTVQNIKGVNHHGNGIYKVAQLSNLYAQNKLNAKVFLKKEQKGPKEILKGWTNVLLSSDIVVDQIQTPEQLNVGEEFNISFTVSETNGDIGGTTLVKVMHEGEDIYITEVEVDEGEEVNVDVPLTFDVAGSYDLSITATDIYYEQLGVYITDYDATSNVNFKTIEVIASKEQPISFRVAYEYEAREDYENSINGRNYYEKEGLYVQFISHFGVNGDDIYDLRKGTLNIKVETDNGYSQEWNYDMRELEELAVKNGADHHIEEGNKSYFGDETFYDFYSHEYYHSDNTHSSEFVSQEYTEGGLQPEGYYLKDGSSVRFQYITYDRVKINGANSVLVEVKLTSAEGDIFIVQQDVINNAIDSWEFDNSKYYSVSGNTQ